MVRVIAIGLGLLLVIGSASAQDSPPPFRNVSRVFVHATLIGVLHDGNQELASGTVDASPGRPGSAVYPIDFRTPAGDRVTELELSIEGSSSGGTIHLTVTTIVQAAMPRQKPVGIRRVREAQVSQGGTFLHQVYESPDHESSLVLTLTPELRVVPEFVQPTAGSPIVFRVVMSRITETGVVDLENNILRTLGDNPVAYSFKTAPGRTVEEAADPDVPSSAPHQETSPPSSPWDGQEISPPSSGEGRRSAEPPAKAPAVKGKRARPAPKRLRVASPSSSPSSFPNTQRVESDADAASSSSHSPSSPPSSPSGPSSGESAAKGQAPPEVRTDGAAAPAGTAEAPAAASGGAAPSAGDVPGDADSGAPVPPSTGPVPPESEPGEEIELTLSPRKAADGILVVEATLRRRLEIDGVKGMGSETARKTGVLTRGGVMEILVGGTGEHNLGAYKFRILADF